MIELLSPAGDKDSFIAAVQSGADAVYMGLDKFNARQMANNFTLEEYIWCLDYAHMYNVKVYLTLNTLLNSDEIKEALKLTLNLYNHGLDAVILQDIGMAYVIKNNVPGLALHASTQMTVHNLKQAKFLKELGFKRIVLAREMTINEIEYIAKNIDIELEVFIHGALCVSYSGQCLMSYMIGKRSANRGKCGGTCRLKYSLYENDKFLTEGHLLSKKDIFGIDYVNALKNLGITSLKIEGRGKTKEYVHIVTSKYRKMLDENNLSEDDEKDMLQIFNRSSKSSGYFEKVLSKESISYKLAKNTGLYLGRVLDRKGKFIKIKLNEDISMHDGVESEESSEASTIITCIKDENGNILNKDVKRGNTVYIGDFKNLPNINDRINKTSSKKQLDMAEEFLSKIRRKVNVNLDIRMSICSNIDVSYEVYNKKYNLSYEYIPKKAINKAITKEDIEDSMSKTENEFFILNITKLSLDDNIFVPKSILNDIRRNIIETLKENLVIRHDLKVDFFDPKIEENKENRKSSNSLYIYKYNENSIEKYNEKNAERVYINISDIMKNGEKILDSFNKDIYILLPNIILKNLEKYIDDNLESLVKHKQVKGILTGNIGYLDECTNLKEKYNLNLVIDYTLNVSNIYSAYIYANYYKVDMICLSPEIEQSEIEKILSITNVELALNYITVMTSRFCPIKAFSGGCNCLKNKYKLIDSYNNEYFIVTDNLDCVVRLVRKLNNSQNSLKDTSVRFAIL